MGKLVSALAVGLIVGVVVGYFFIAQPQISGLQTDLAKSQSELSKARSGRHTMYEPVVELHIE